MPATPATPCRIPPARTHIRGSYGRGCQGWQAWQPWMREGETICPRCEWPFNSQGHLANCGETT